MDKNVLALMRQRAKEYNLLLIKKPRHDKFMLFNYRNGTLRDGEGFSLNEDDVKNILRYYTLKFRNPNYIKVGNGCRKLNRDEEIKYLDLICNRLNQNECIRGHYSREENDSPFETKSHKNTADIKLRKRARACNLLLIRYPYQPIMDPEIDNRYTLINLKKGKSYIKKGYKIPKEVIEAILEKVEKGILFV